MRMPILGVLDDCPACGGAGTQECGQEMKRCGCDINLYECPECGELPHKLFLGYRCDECGWQHSACNATAEVCPGEQAHVPAALEEP